MKELSIEEKAKRYDEVIPQLKGLLDGIREEKCDIMEEDIIRIFPEVKESEDEMIRKALIKYLDALDDDEIRYGVSFKDMRTWLEKQGEQKFPIEKLPSEMKTIGESLGFTTQEDCDRYNQMVTDLIMSDDDKGEQKPIVPKFKVGDWICNNVCSVYITSIKNGMYYFDGGNSLSILFVDNHHYHLWTIQDAKAGDVLIDGEDENPFIFKGLLDKHHPKCPVAYCGIDFYGTFVISSSSCSWWTGGSVYPATKEQRDVLFYEMKKAGWEWDAYKKELKLIEPFN